MDAATRRTLDDVNRRFYAERAAVFAATRERPWPGWTRCLEGAGAPAACSADAELRVLDVGCGNGRLAAFLAGHRAVPTRYTGIDYLGIDASGPLLDAARSRPELRAASGPACWARFEATSWVRDPVERALPPGPFDWVLLFGVLHHVPGRALREALLAQGLQSLRPGGRLALTVWRFANAAARRQRLVPRSEWRSLGVRADAEQLEPGDHLLRWGHDPGALRYCHQMEPAELDAHLARLPARVVDRFDADGRDGGGNHYVVLERRGG